MSIRRAPPYVWFLLLFTAVLVRGEAAAQHVAAEISVDAASRKVLVKGRFENGFRPPSGRSFAFRRAAAVELQRCGGGVGGC